MSVAAARQRFTDAIQADPVDLGRAALWIAQGAYPNLEAEEYLATLDEMAAELQERIPPERYPMRILKTLKKKPQRKRGRNYGHPGTTRNGFGWINHAELLNVQHCPICGNAVARHPQGTKRQQVAELVPDLVEVWEYERPLYRCSACE